MKTLNKLFYRALIVVGLSFLLAGFARAQNNDTVYCVTYKQITCTFIPCPEGRIGCLVYHFRTDTSGIKTIIFNTEKEADTFIENENKKIVMDRAIDIRKEKFIRARVNSR